MDKSHFRIEKLIVGLLDIPYRYKEAGVKLISDFNEKLADKTLSNLYILFLSDMDNQAPLTAHL